MIKASFALLVVMAMTISQGQAGLNMEKIDQLLDTKYTPIDMNNDGTPDVSRTFVYGELVRVSYSYPMTEAGTEEVWQLSPNKTWTELTIYKHRLPISRVIEQYTDETRDKILKVENYWQSGNDPILDMRVIDEFVGGNKVSEKAQLKNGTWQVVSKESVAIEIDSAADTSGKEEYAQCLNRKTANPSTCVACLNTIKTAIDGSVNNLITSLPLSDSCEDDSFMYFGEGLRADKNRCFPPSTCVNLCGTCTVPPCPPCSDPNFATCQSNFATQQVNVKARLNASMAPFRDMIKCLNQKNPKLVAKMLKTLIQKRPIIDCVNQPTDKVNVKTIGRVEGLSDQKIAELGRSTGGFYWGDKPNRIYLTNASPTVRSNTANIGEVIFHELIHSCGLPGNHHHNDPKGTDFAKDPIYGCEMLCATTPSAEIKKQRRKIAGCNACLTAEGNTGTAAAECTAANGWY